MRVYVVFVEFCRQILVVFSKALGIGCVVESNENGVVHHTEVAVETLKEALAKMAGLPLLVWLAQALAELVNDGLGNERHGQLGISDMEIQCSGTVPSHGLVGVEELFEMPTVRIIIT